MRALICTVELAITVPMVRSTTGILPISTAATLTGAAWTRRTAMGEIPKASQDQRQRRAPDRKRAATPARRIVPIVASHGRSLERVDLNVHCDTILTWPARSAGTQYTTSIPVHCAEGRFRDA